MVIKSSSYNYLVDTDYYDIATIQAICAAVAYEYGMTQERLLLYIKDGLDKFKCSQSCSRHSVIGVEEEA